LPLPAAVGEQGRRIMMTRRGSGWPAAWICARPRGEDADKKGAFGLLAYLLFR